MRVEASASSTPRRGVERIWAARWEWRVRLRGRKRPEAATVPGVMLAVGFRLRAWSRRRPKSQGFSGWRAGRFSGPVGGGGHDGVDIGGVAIGAGGVDHGVGLETGDQRMHGRAIAQVRLAERGVSGAN